MSNTVINWRFWAYHLQVLRWRDWPASIRRGDWADLVRWSFNPYWARGGMGRQTDDWTPVRLYDGKRYALALVAVAIIAALAA